MILAIPACDIGDSRIVVCESEGCTEGVYTPRNAEDSPIYQTVAKNLETFLSDHQQRDRPVPFFVERELRAFLNCGIPSHGFLRVHCDSCGCDRIVPFSCKGRGFCSSCGGRRMADTAAHLVDRVLPEVRARQWVLTLPYTLRFLMAFDAKLIAEIQILASGIKRSCLAVFLAQCRVSRTRA